MSEFLIPGLALFGLATSLVLCVLVRAQAKARQEAERRAQRLEAERARLSSLLMAAPAAIAMTQGPKHVYVLSNPINNAWIGHREVLGKPFREAFPEAESDGFLALLDQVYRTGESFSTPEMPLRLPQPDGSVRELFISFVYQPTRDTQGSIDGIAGFAFDVTALVLARRKMEALAEELRTGESRLRTLVESNIIGILFWDIEGGVRGANDAFLQSVGYTREDLDAGRMDWRQFTPPDWRAQDEVLVRELLERGKHPPVEKEYFRKDGSRLPLIVASSFFPDNRREGVGFVLDITARKHAEAALRQSEARAQEAATVAVRNRAQLEATFQSMSDGVVVFDMEGRVVFVNEAEARICGYPSAEDMKRDLQYFAQVFELTHPDRQLLPVEQWPVSRVLRGETLLECELRGRRKDTGQAWFFSYSGAPVRDEHGNQVLALTITRDVTESKKAEERLRDSELQFRTLADAIPQLAWIAETDGAIRWFNRRWYEYTGTSPEDMAAEANRGWQTVHDPAELPRVLAGFEAALASGEPWEDLFPLRRHDGELRWHLSRAMPLRNAEGRIVRWFGTNTDVEDQRRQAVELRKAIEARDTFLVVASHELKTPLTALSLRLAQVLREVRGAVAAGEQHRARELRNLEAAEGQLRRLAGLVDSLLDVTRISGDRLSLVLGDVDVVEAVRETVQGMAAQAERAGSPLHVEAPAHAWCRLDRVRLGQAVTNLLSNAIKFGAGQPIRVALATDGKAVRLTVSDRGIGIAPETLERLFERFERGVSERHYGGLGLGLYFTRKIVEAMGGTVKAQSAPGQGATFTVELPAASHQEAP
ncbi:PAS domain-containing sensor histidine kinase [Stigmatella aurantiaca]|uniref:PAS domain-containing sensor histidine kinase n=1 Tax=Stigmatella aurantiaca TaxID=41 RepID=UPI0015A564A1|nr:PAS domain S-box protein [Stigmatella aurantiaca]